MPCGNDCNGLWNGGLVELGDAPPGFPNAFTMSRDELLDFLAERAVGFEPYIEVVYHGVVDPTA
jgi:hypothetical protein